MEDMVNEWIRRAVRHRDVIWRSYQEAVAAGAMALFGEKYGDRVRDASNVPGFSLELCGGCHVRNTGEIGALPGRVASAGVASGVRRIEALDRQLRAAGGPAASAPPTTELTQRLGIRSGDFDQQIQKADQLRQRQNELEQEMKRLRMQLVSGTAAPAEEEMMVTASRWWPARCRSAPSNELREIADTLRSKIGSGVVVIGSRSDGNVSLVAAVIEGPHRAG